MTDRLLVLCTGNICRSPYLAALLAEGLADRDVLVESAGTGAVVGSGMHPESLRRWGSRGRSHAIPAAPSPALDVQAFRARQLTPLMVEAADLVIGATRQHATFADGLVRALPQRSWSLGDLAHVLGSDGAGSVPLGEGLGVLAAWAFERRVLLDGIHADETDVIDPYGRPLPVWDLMDNQISVHLPPVLTALRAASRSRA